MIDRPVIFIASSTEGAADARALGQRLTAMLGERKRTEPEFASAVDGIDLQFWQPQFQLSEGFMESLEAAMERADFAVVVARADDPISLRGEERVAPRDNVVFELGFFMGRLRRERAYLVHEHRPEIRLPSDLHGLTLASYRRTNEAGAESPFDDACRMILDRIGRKGARPRQVDREVGRLEEAWHFSRQVAGYWWSFREYRRDTLGFVHIGIESSFLAPRVDGRAFDRNGEDEARWDSLASCIDAARRTLHFAFKGTRPVDVVAPQPQEAGSERGATHEFRGFNTYTFKLIRGRVNSADGELRHENLNLAKSQSRRLTLVRCEEDEVRTVLDAIERAKRNRLARLVGHRLDAQWGRTG